MEKELLRIFDENRRPMGTATREEVHQAGYWHETFHCWLVSTQGDQHTIYLQLRSQQKKDYPGLLDITAAGHLLADETVQDGVREVQEELGIAITYEDLLPLGVIDYTLTRGSMIDRELANVHLCVRDIAFEDFKPQLEEVEGMMAADWDDFCQLWQGETDQIPANGFVVNSSGERAAVHRQISQRDFAPHENDYYEQIIHLINEQLTKDAL